MRPIWLMKDKLAIVKVELIGSAEPTLMRAEYDKLGHHGMVFLFNIF